MDVVSAEFRKLLKTSLQQGIPQDVIQAQFLQHLRIATIEKNASPRNTPPNISSHSKQSVNPYPWKFVTVSIFTAVIAVCVYQIPIEESSVNNLIDLYRDYVSSTPCILNEHLYVKEIARPVFKCDHCRGLTSVPVVYDISQEEFAEKYAFTRVPVLIKVGIML